MTSATGRLPAACASARSRRIATRPGARMRRSNFRACGWVSLLVLLASLRAVGAADELAGHEGGHARPFRRAMVLSGMGPDGLLYLGAYDAAVDLGRAPDLLIATSGGSLAAGLIMALPDRAERNAFLASRALHSMMLTIEVDQGDPNRVMAKVPGWYLQSAGVFDCPPRVFGRSIVTVPQTWNDPRVSQAFPTNHPGPRVVVIAAHLERTPRVDLPGATKRFSEAWITDRETAALLRGSTSALACRYPRSALVPNVRVIDRMSIGQSVRASLAEPHIFNPSEFEGEHYLGGIINLYPIEAANSLADEVVTVRLRSSILVFESMFRGVFRFSLNERQAFADSQPVAARIDFRDKEEALAGRSFWFHVKRVRRKADVQAVENPECETDKVWLIPRRTVVDGVPEDHAEFVRYVRAQYEYGYRRAVRCLQGCASGATRAAFRVDPPIERDAKQSSDPRAPGLARRGERPEQD